MSFHSELHAARISPRAEWEREHFGPAVLPQNVEEVIGNERTEATTDPRIARWTRKVAYFNTLADEWGADGDEEWREICLFTVRALEALIAKHSDPNAPIFASGLIADPIPDDPGEEICPCCFAIGGHVDDCELVS